MRAAIFQHLAIFIFAVCAGGPPPVARADGSPERVRSAIFDVGPGVPTAVAANAMRTVAGTAGNGKSDGPRRLPAADLTL